MCQYLGGYHTNNQAEYAGLIAGLEAALDLGCRNIKVKGDSTLIIRQVGERVCMSGWGWQRAFGLLCCLLAPLQCQGQGQQHARHLLNGKLLSSLPPFLLLAFLLRLPAPGLPTALPTPPPNPSPTGARGVAGEKRGPSAVPRRRLPAGAPL